VPVNSGKHARKNPADICHVIDHSLANILSELPGPKVLTLHDLIPWRYPEQHKNNQLAYARWKKRVQCAGQADIILCDSKATAEDAEHFLSLPQEKIRICPLALLPCYHQPTQAEQETARKKFNIEEDEILLLYVGTDVKRKNLSFLLDVLEEVNKEIPWRGNWRFFKSRWQIRPINTKIH